MNISIRQIRYVYEVALTGSIAAAAEAIPISKSALLSAIIHVESQIGFRIFERRPARGVKITPAGKQFMLAAQDMLEAKSAFNRCIANLTRPGTVQLRIGCFEPFGALFMPDVLKRYIQGQGEVDIQLREGDQSQLRSWLAADEVDLIVTYDIGFHLDEEVSRICKVPCHALLSIQDPLAEQEAVSLADLALRPLVLLDLPQTAAYLLALFEISPCQPHVRFRTRSYETVRAAVSAGFGCSILNMCPSGSATRDGPELIRRPFADFSSAPTLIVQDKHGREKPAFIQDFITATQQHFRQLGPEGFAVATPALAATLFQV
ncbi:LysR substrate-binding domain-containing protein [Chromobacterium haemolyticum]|uniref:LysR substrate-binding domain-containing protein n=1 Tax=Chromobacterium haemolyticum TaxID=394935 RepID=UPI004056805F